MKDKIEILDLSINKDLQAFIDWLEYSQKWVYDNIGFNECVVGEPQPRPTLTQQP